MSMSPSATPATWNQGACRQMPRLPRQQPQRPRVPLRPKRAIGASPVPYVPCLPRKSGSRCHQVPRLPRETKVDVDVTECHACHVKRRWMSPSATPATPTAAASPRPTPAQACHRSQPSAIRATPATQKVEVDVTK